MTKKKKRNPNDMTGRNNKARAREIEQLRNDISDMNDRLNRLFAWAETTAQTLQQVYEPDRRYDYRPILVGVQPRRKKK